VTAPVAPTNYTSIPNTPLLRCDRCGAMIDGSPVGYAAHNSWHSRAVQAKTANTPAITILGLGGAVDVTITWDTPFANATYKCFVWADVPLALGTPKVVVKALTMTTVVVTFSSGSLLSVGAGSITTMAFGLT
jgi:hypothetical protein